MNEIMAGDVVLRTTSLCLSYGKRTILRDVNMEIRAADFWFLVGPNGEGKSTLMKAVLGALRPSRGSIELHPALEGRARIGYVPQRSEMNATLPTTVREFVTIGLVGVGTDDSAVEQDVAWALDRVALGGMADRDYWSLSGGQRQRALVARALARRPRFLLIDEPTNGLDLAAEALLLESLARLNRDEQLTVLFVTHDLANAVRYGSRFALFHDGSVATGAYDEVMTGENLARTYGVPIEVRRERSGDLDLRVHPEGSRR